MKMLYTKTVISILLLNLGSVACSMDRPDEESLYNMYEKDHIKDFLIIFKDQQTQLVRNCFELRMGFEKLLDLKTGDSLAQQALGMKELKKDFIKTVLQYDNPNHRNKLGESTMATAQRYYLAGKLSKKMYDFIEAEHARSIAQRTTTT